jgi:hypothetical protein
MIDVWRESSINKNKHDLPMLAALLYHAEVFQETIQAAQANGVPGTDLAMDDEDRFADRVIDEAARLGVRLSRRMRFIPAAPPVALICQSMITNIWNITGPDMRTKDDLIGEPFLFFLSAVARYTPKSRCV